MVVDLAVEFADRDLLERCVQGRPVRPMMETNNLLGNQMEHILRHLVLEAHCPAADDIGCRLMDRQSITDAAWRNIFSRLSEIALVIWSLVRPSIWKGTT